MAMGKQRSTSKTNDPAALLHSSSIAILRERFRQLQRIKETREERELLRMFADTATQHPHLSPKSNRCEQQSNWFSRPDLVHPSRPLHTPPSSLRLHSHAKQTGTIDVHNSETSLSIGLWPERTNTNVRAPKISDEMDVDTSLHL